MIETAEGLPAKKVSLRFTIPGVPKNPSNQRLHWAALRRLQHGFLEMARLLAQSARREAGWPVARESDRFRHVFITLHRWRLLDDDNAVASVKGLIDCLAGACLLYNDRRPYAVIMPVKQVKTARLLEKVEVEIVQEEHELW